MNKSYLIKLIEENGWKEIRQHDEIFGHNFDIIGERRFALAKWYILINFTNKLTKDNILKFQNDFADISKKSKSWILGKCFLYCIIADNIDSKITDGIERDTFGLFGLLRLKGGGGNVFFVDLSKSKIYGKTPTLPYDVHKHSKDLTEILQKAM